MASTQVKVLGSWASAYTHRVQLALKLKGIEFEYVEEDLAAKSPSLLLYNPVHKKVPVLFHGDKPIAESAVILEYIDETWREQSQLMPSCGEPYERAMLRFWSRFVDDKLGPAVGDVFRSPKEELEAAVARVHDNLKLLEEELQDGFFKGRRFFGGEEIGLLDIVIGCGSYWLWAFEEIAGVKLLEDQTFPRFHAWLREFEEHKLVKETIPPADKLLQYAKGLQVMMMCSQKNAQLD